MNSSVKKGSLTNIFSFFNHGGDHYLQEKRMILSSTDAWGVLRKDLIDTLGIQRAKRFLLRYGWNCGKNEARMLKELVNWESDLDWVLAGSQMHQIGGRVFSYPEEFHIDVKKGIFNVTGYWIDSYEAKQHLQHYPLYHEPICYFLMGYGGGYNSECLGKKVIFKETHCIGKGDKQCRYVAKTVEEWGEEIDEELINYEEQDIADELDIVYRRVEQQSTILHIGSSITKKLTSALLKGKEMDSFADILLQELKMPVVIQNQYFDIIAQAFNNDLENDNEQECIIGKIKEIIEGKFKHNILTQTEQFEISNNQHILISPIIIQNDVYGYISIFRNDMKFSAAEVDYLERAASICAVKMLNERAAIQAEERMKGDLLEELFKGETDSSEIIKRFSYFGYNINQPKYVLVIDFTNTNIYSNADKAIVKKKRRLISDFFNREENHYQTSFIKFEKEDKIAILIPNEYLEKKKTAIRELSQHCYNILQEADDKGKIFIGVSGLCAEVDKYSQKYEEANKAIEIAKAKYRLKRDDYQGVIHVDDLGHMMILLDARKPEGLLEYAHKYLQPLKQYDEKYSSELLKTLYYYIENECNLHKTARDMNVSVSGMKYRIQRIEELINVSLSRTSSKFEIQLSLQTYLAFSLL